MKRAFNWLLIFAFLFQFIAVSCDKEDTLPDPPIPDPDPEEIPEEVPEASDVNKFIWEGLAVYYYWVNNIPNLTNAKFNDTDTLNYFLNQFSDPEELFYSLLYKYQEVDKWSTIFDDYTEIDDWLSGVSETTGIVSLPLQIGESGDVVCLAIYVLKNSPADLAGIKRGEYFLRVNNTQLTVDNYWELLHSSGTKDFQMASLSEDYVISLNGISHSVSTEVIQENPVFLDTVLNVDGWKVGYLVYNGFTSAYDEVIENSYDLVLNDAFSDFKSAGIDKLVLDFRYNLGGSVQSAIYLASMIYSTDKNIVLAKTEYNDLIESEFIKLYGEDYLTDYFTDFIYEEEWTITDDAGNPVKTVNTPRTAISNLNLNDLYIITSGNTASASELLINGLSPYITVKTVGTNTRGKNVGSWTIKDWIDDEGNLNPNHTWGMQPIVAKIANSEGYSEYINGLQPDIEADEDIRNLMPFGDPNETLLKIVLDDIRGITTKSATTRPAGFKPLKISKELYPLSMQLNIDNKSFKTIISKE